MLVCGICRLFPNIMSIESKSKMPTTVKAIIVALFVALVVNLIAAYIEGQELEGMGFVDASISSKKLIWV